MSLKNTKAFGWVDPSVWADHIFVTKDFINVVETFNAKQLKYDRGSDTVQECDDFLRLIWWIARISDESAKDKIILMSSFECDELLPDFRTSKNAVLYMYWPRTSQSHDNMLQNDRLYVTGMLNRCPIDLSDEVQINTITGAQYFANDEEQDEFCSFLGLTPLGNRQHSKDISECLRQNKFKTDPVEMAIKIIETHHKEVHTESHVASILLKGVLATIKDRNVQNGF